MNFTLILNISLILLVYIVLFSLIFVVSSMYRLKTRKQQLAALHNNLQVGSEVMFSNGLVGNIQELGEEFVMIRVGQSTDIKVSRYAITQLL